MTIRSMREYTARYYPDGHCQERMEYGLRGVRLQRDCGMKGRHITIKGEWRCCEHYDGPDCDGGCWARDILRGGRP